MVQWTNLQRIENPARIYIHCKKSGDLYLAEPGLTAGWQACWQFGRQNLGKARDFQCLLPIEILDFSLCLAKVLQQL